MGCLAVGFDEYLDIARGFFTGPEPGLANAVLDRLARSLRATEF
jgi:transcription antitermination protein NusB